MLLSRVIYLDVLGGENRPLKWTNSFKANGSITIPKQQQELFVNLMAFVLFLIDFTALLLHLLLKMFNHLFIV